MYDLIKFKAKNFIAFYTGMKVNKIEIDFEKYDSKIFILKAKNGKGKTSLLSILHPMPYSTDVRTKLIRPGKNGYKELMYRNQRGDELHCKIVYTASKTGHTTKAFLIKKNGLTSEEEDLNPNGNITSYTLSITNILGIDKEFLQLTSHNDSAKGIVTMTSSERRTTAFKIIKGLDEYIPYQKIISERFKNIRIIISSITDKLGKMNDEEFIDKKIKSLSNELTHLGERRDKLLNKKGGVQELLKKFPDNFTVDNVKRNIGELNQEIIKLNFEYNDIKKLFNGIEYTVDKLESYIHSKINDNKLLENTNEMYNRNYIELIQELDNLKNQLNQLNTSKENISENSLNDIDEYITTNKKKLKDFNEKYKWIKLNITKDDILRILTIQTTIYNEIESVFSFNAHNIEEILHVILKNGIDKAFEYISDEDTTIFTDIETMSSQLNIKENNYDNLVNKISEQNEIISLRPKNCKIDDCPFIINSLKYKNMDNKIIAERNKIIKFKETINEYKIKRTDLQEKYTILKAIDRFFNLIDSVSSIMMKLPKDIRIEKDDLIKSFIKRDFDYIAKDYEKYISVIEKKYEFDDIEKTIDDYSRQKKFIKSNPSLFKNIDEDIINIENKITSKKINLETISAQIENNKNQILKNSSFVNNLISLKDNVLRYEEIIKAIPEKTESRNMLQKNLDDYKNIITNYNNIQVELNEITSLIQPKSTEKLMYSHEMIKIREYKNEFKILEEDLTIVNILRDAVMPKGMPTLLIDFYMDDVRKIANTLLSHTFDGGLYLEEFIINEKEFTIPYRKLGELGDDISLASTSERSFIRLAISLALYEVYGSDVYGIILLDEVDGGLDDENKDIFVNILLKQVERVGMSKIFVITHNHKYYRNTDYVTINFKKGVNDDENIYLLGE